jgi:hypothetical protein
LREEKFNVMAFYGVPEYSPKEVLQKECREKIMEHGKEVMVTGMKLRTPTGEYPDD